MHKAIPNVKDTLLVQEFPNIFPNNLLGLTLEKEVEFSIKLTIGTIPISKGPNGIAPTELQKLKK